MSHITGVNDLMSTMKDMSNMDKPLTQSIRKWTEVKQ